MASYQAVGAACEALIQLLRGSYRAGAFGPIELDFRVYGSQDFNSPMQAGVSLFLHRLAVDGVNRNPTRRTPDGARPMLPLDVHFLLTAWGRDPALQGMIATWMMRCLQDHPLLPAALLNATWPGAFRPEESLEVLPDELSTTDLIHLWERLSERGWQLSVPYVARVIQVESSLSAVAPALVGQRTVQTA